MAYQQTVASSLRDLLAVIRTFAQADGWTVVYDETATKGQLGLSKGNCHVALGEPVTNTSGSEYALYHTVNYTDQVNGGTVTDHYLFMALGTSLNAARHAPFGHPGSIYTSYSGTDTAVLVNDMLGPFTNVWLFSDAGGNYIHCVVQSAAERYTHFSFGHLDVKGMTVPRSAYAVGMEHIWWPDASDYSANSSCDFNFPGSIYHYWGLVYNGPRVNNVMIPAGVLNTSYSWGRTAPFCTTSLETLMHVGDQKDDQYRNGPGSMLDIFLGIQNQVTTSGIPLTSLPCIFQTGTTDAAIACWLGEYPDIRLVNISNLNPAQEIKFGSDTWMVFPWKRKGSFENTNYGSNPLPEVNTIFYGIAVKKVV